LPLHRQLKQWSDRKKWVEEPFIKSYLFVHINRIDAYYIKKVLIGMKIGGISNKSIGNRVKGLLFDLKAMRNNGIFVPIVTLILKPVRKIKQYFS